MKASTLLMGALAICFAGPVIAKPVLAPRQVTGAGDACLSNSDCVVSDGEALECDNGVCRLVSSNPPPLAGNGEACTLDAECQSLFCSSSVCADFTATTNIPAGSHCLFASNCQIPSGADTSTVACACPESQQCDGQATDAFVCTVTTDPGSSPVDVGGSCTRDAECGSGWCSASICADPTTSGGTVAAGDHCTQDAVCMQATDSSSTCACPTDATCDAPNTDALVCTVAENPTTPTTDIADGGDCEVDAVCINRFCQSGKCVDPNQSGLQIPEGEHCPSGFNSTCVQPQALQNSNSSSLSAACLCPTSTDCSTATDAFVCTLVNTVIEAPPTTNNSTDAIDCACENADPDNCLDLGPLEEGEYAYCGPPVQQDPPGSTIGIQNAPDPLYKPPPDPDFTDEELDTFKTMELSTLATILQDPLQGEEPIDLPYCGLEVPEVQPQKRSLFSDIFRGAKRPKRPVFNVCPRSPPRLNVQVQFTVVSTTRANNLLVTDESAATAIQELNTAFSGMGISFEQTGGLWRRSARSKDLLSRSQFNDYQRFARFPDEASDWYELEKRVLMSGDGRRGIADDVLNVFIVEEIVNNKLAAEGVRISGHCYFPEYAKEISGCVITMDSMTGVTLKDIGNTEGGNPIKGTRCAPGVDDFCERGKHLPWTSEQAAAAYTNFYMFRRNRQQLRGCFGYDTGAVRAKRLKARGLEPEHPKVPSLYQRLLEHRRQMQKRALLAQRPNVVEELTAICQTPFTPDDDPIIDAVLPDAKADIRNDPAPVEFSISGGTQTTLSDGRIQINLAVETTDASGATVTSALPLITQSSTVIAKQGATPAPSGGTTTGSGRSGVASLTVTTTSLVYEFGVLICVAYDHESGAESSDQNGDGHDQNGGVQGSQYYYNHSDGRQGGYDAQQQQQRQAFHVLRVADGSPAADAGVDPFFDFLVGVNGQALGDDVDILTDALEQNEGRQITLQVYSTKRKEMREVTVVPSRTWSSAAAATQSQEPSGAQPSLLGLSLRLCNPQQALEQVWHVLEILEGSPAQDAGKFGVAVQYDRLVPFGDWVVGYAGGVLRGEGDFYDVVESHIDKPLRLFVYNADYDVTREAILVPNRNWGGEGLLGCGVGYGLLHRIPRPQDRTRIPQDDETDDSAANSPVPAYGGGVGRSAAPVFQPPPPQQPSGPTFTSPPRSNVQPPPQSSSFTSPRGPGSNMAVTNSSPARGQAQSVVSPPRRQAALSPPRRQPPQTQAQQPQQIDVYDEEPYSPQGEYATSHGVSVVPSADDEGDDDGGNSSFTVPADAFAGARQMSVPAGSKGGPRGFMSPMPQTGFKPPPPRVATNSASVRSPTRQTA
ncbi:hypothetical protein OIO90_002537 [Microbotryomycetes sp. JL221]|nr:hypothetical protein OIO90_002537 [Microbotryomycetes sp. JL221]